MMENRSFDHLIGWAGTDEAYLDAGRQRYGAKFTIDGNQTQSYTDAQGQEVATHWLPGTAGEQYPYQGCGENIPGHGWGAGRVQMHRGLPRQGERQRPVHARVLRGVRHAVHRAALCGASPPPTDGSRRCSGRRSPTASTCMRRSRRARSTPGTADPGMFHTKTIWDNLRRAKVPSAYYYTDLPIAPLWGQRLYDVTHSVNDYFDTRRRGGSPTW